MKPVTLTVVFTAFLALTVYAQPLEWRDISGCLDGDEPHYVLTSPGNTFFVNNGKGVFRTTDCGQTWQASSEGIADLALIYAFKGNAVGEGFCASLDGTLYRTTNDGKHWSRHADLPFDSMRVLLTYDGSFYAWKPESGAYKSEDGGSTWTRVFKTAFDYDDVFAMAADANGTLYLGTRENGIFRTTDEGENWEHVYTPTFKVHRFQIEHDTVVYAWIDNKIWNSSDYGETWERFIVPEASRFVIEDEQMYFLITGKLHRSTDGGATYTDYPDYHSMLHLAVMGPDTILAWRQNQYVSVYTEQAEKEKKVLFQNTAANTTVISSQGIYYSVYPRHILESHDSGSTWVAFEVAQTEATHIYQSSGYTSAICYRSAGDAGLYFALKHPDSSSFRYRKLDSLRSAAPGEPLAISSPSKGTFDILCNIDYIWRTTNFGVSWDVLETPPPNHEWKALHSVTDSVLVIAGSREVAVTTDRGTSWTLTNGGGFVFSQSRAGCITVDMSGGIYVGGRYLQYSSDYGKTWSILDLQRNDAFCAATDSAGNILIGTEAGLYISPSPDSAFVRQNGNLEDFTNDLSIADLSVMPDGRIIAATASHKFIAQGPKPDQTVSVAEPVAVAAFTLHAPYPNPFTAQAAVQFTLEGRSAVELAVYNTLGRRVATLASGTFNAGSFIHHWNGTDDTSLPLPPGSYFLRLATPAGVKTVRLLKAR